MARQGLDFAERQGEVVCGAVWQGLDFNAGYGVVWISRHSAVERGEARSGVVRQGFHGSVLSCKAGRCQVLSSVLGVVL